MILSAVFVVLTQIRRFFWPRLPADAMAGTLAGRDYADYAELRPRITRSCTDYTDCTENIPVQFQNSFYFNNIISIINITNTNR